MDRSLDLPNPDSAFLDMSLREQVQWHAIVSGILEPGVFQQCRHALLCVWSDWP